MTATDKSSLLADHADMRLVALDSDESATDRNRIVRLSADHPGFHDQKYLLRRNQIAQIALDYKTGHVIPNAPYTEEEDQVWQSVWDALETAHREHACAEYLRCVEDLDLDRQRIPQLSEISEKINAKSGFGLEPVAGLVEPRVFLESLARGVFLCTQYIRHHSTPLYTPEPDVVHEIIGHAISLASPQLAELNRLFGKAVARTTSAEGLDQLARVYWFTIEFGVLREAGKVKAYGTGLLSSAGELAEMHNADLLPLDLEATSYQSYDPSKYQPILFCADSFEAMFQSVRDYLARR